MTKHLVFAAIGLGAAALAVALVFFFGWERQQNASDGTNKTFDELEKKILTKEQAIQIAKDEWHAHGGKSPDPSLIDVTLDAKSNEYTVVFKTPPAPPTVRRADYTAKFTLDATTGEIKKRMVGS